MYLSCTELMLCTNALCLSETIVDSTVFQIFNNIFYTKSRYSMATVIETLTRIWIELNFKFLAPCGNHKMICTVKINDSPAAVYGQLLGFILQTNVYSHQQPFHVLVSIEAITNSNIQEKGFSLSRHLKTASMNDLHFA